METASCPISNSKEFTQYIQVPDRFDCSGKALWNLVRSCDSGLIMLNPRPDGDEIAQHYRSGVYDPYLHSKNSATLRDRAYLAARTLLLRYRADLIMKGHAKPMEQCRILEIGCSTGDLLNYFHRTLNAAIDNLVGVEPDAEAAQYARNSFGLNIFSSITKESVGMKTFDRIVLWHTLEHIHSINETLNHAVNQLKQEGVLVIALPNPASFDAEYYGENWIAYDAPRHLYHFVPETLEKLLRSHKLTIFRRLPYFPDVLYNAFHSEALRCKRQNHSFNSLRFVDILWRSLCYLIRGKMLPMRASSLVYYARRTM
ncbi:MAG: class I SAM-dependent methyltransferase [Chlorobiaceae bacterium]